MNLSRDKSNELDNFETCDSQESIKLVIDETIRNDEPQNIIKNIEYITNATTYSAERQNESLSLNLNIKTQKNLPKITPDQRERRTAQEELMDVNVELNNYKSDGSIFTTCSGAEQLTTTSARAIIEIVDDEDMNSMLINSMDIQNYKNDTFNNVEDRTVINYEIVNDIDNEAFNEVFYNMECVNYECPQNHKQFCKAPLFAFSYFKLPKKRSQARYICMECYDMVVDVYEAYCTLLKTKQPLLLKNISTVRHEYVEISDSSDEEKEPTHTRINEEEFQKFDMSVDNLALIEEELNNAVKSVMINTDIHSQLTWTKAILMQRIECTRMETTYLNKQLDMLEVNVNKIHENLYNHSKINTEDLSPLELSSNYAEWNTSIVPDSLDNADNLEIPPLGEVVRSPIQLNAVYYAVKNNAIARWVPCKLIEHVDTCPNNIKHYKIRFLKSAYHLLKTVPAKHLAYYNAPDVKLSIGERVIAFFDATSLARGKEKINVQSAFYPGIIAETIKPSNKFRYLIFYDDGYTQYVHHKDVRLVCHVSENVWEDIHPDSRDFIRKYLTYYTVNRPMVQTQKGQTMSTQSGGHWVHARVVDIDCSLVLMQFDGPRSHTEWIYRGSLRLAPVFKEYQKGLKNAPSFTSTPTSTRLSRRTEPFIRYTEDEEASSAQQQSDRARAVARKTFSKPLTSTSTSEPSYSLLTQHLHWHSPQWSQKPIKHLNNSTIYLEDENKPKGKVVYYTAKRNLPPRKYALHKCSPSCLIDINNNLNPYSPLSKPLLSGWERLIIRQKIKKGIAYRAPCGKIMRNMKDLHYYLRATRNPLNVDNFDFNIETNCLAEYVIESAIVQKRDISNGQENMAIPLVNYYDNTLPPECKYSAKVIPTEGVHINKDVEFLIGCDCEDDCSDKLKCPCWQLTLAGAKYGNSNTPINEVGYQYKRLMEHVPTGIYECNARCKCKLNCLNRVVQQSLQTKLQVFKTSNRGWGLRCINDIPKGSFVCIYAGHLLTEAKANEGGLDAGDEYFAELDYIEVAEQIKEGYESDVEPIEENDEDFYNPEREDDDEFTPSKSYIARSKVKNKNFRCNFQQDDDFQERQIIKFNPDADLNEDSLRESSIRKLFGKDEACYVMDAKITGNLGRYFNHSCSPNLFVQNVFVDTHDLRFPWVAFFSSCHIRAGTELTWNYNYEVGVVPGKVLYCQCGATNCRIRLL